MVLNEQQYQKGKGKSGIFAVGLSQSYSLRQGAATTKHRCWDGQDLLQHTATATHLVQVVCDDLSCLVMVVPKHRTPIYVNKHLQYQREEHVKRTWVEPIEHIQQ